MSISLASLSIAAAESETSHPAEARRAGSARVVADPPSPVGPVLNVQLLGGFVVSGRRGIGIGDTKSRTHVRPLLAIAASSRQGVGRDEAIDALWPRHSDTGAQNRLHHTMHLVRRALGALAWHDEWITLNQSRVQLDPRIVCDAAQLDTAALGPLDRLGNADLIEVIESCRGDWAPDVDAHAISSRRNRAPCWKSRCAPTVGAVRSPSSFPSPLRCRN